MGLIEICRVASRMSDIYVQTTGNMLINNSPPPPAPPCIDNHRFRQPSSTTSRTVTDFPCVMSLTSSTMATRLHLHPDPERTIMPLLCSEPHYPQSLPTLGLFLANLAQTASSLSTISTWSTIPPTHPISTSSTPTEPFVIIALTSPPSAPQFRLYCSLESRPASSYSADDLSSAIELILSSLAYLRRKLISEAVFTEKQSREMYVGGLNGIWVDAMVQRGMLEPGRDRLIRYGVWLSPEDSTTSESSGNQRNQISNEYVIRQGREEDVNLVGPRIWSFSFSFLFLLYVFLFFCFV